MKNKTRLALAALFIIETSWAAVPCGIPARAKSESWSSAQFYRDYSAPSAAREWAVVGNVLKGNVPGKLRAFVPIKWQAMLHGEPVFIEIQVMSDYLMVGTDRDFVRTPLTNYAAQYLASQMGLVMPTPYLVELIYELADVQLTPQPTDWYKNDPQMHLGSNYIVFNNTIERQLAGRTGLIAGHKKDVVLTNRLDQRPEKVAIYGWQMAKNRPLQPLATPHGYTYEDYSHGIRFLGPWVRVKTIRTGSERILPLVTALQEPELGSVLNGGAGAIHDVRAARTCTREFQSAAGLSGVRCPPQPRRCD